MTPEKMSNFTPDNFPELPQDPEVAAIFAEEQLRGDTKTNRRPRLDELDDNPNDTNELVSRKEKIQDREDNEIL